MGYPGKLKFIIKINDGGYTYVYPASSLKDIEKKLSEHYHGISFLNINRHTVYQIRKGESKKYQHIKIEQGSFIFSEDDN